ncbi:MAG: hypothetical protein VYA96_06370, partial [Verrucomicrobiota bacterium]|nr:hypothetical protein [Verrucomicrobiota bacterium]
MKTISLINYKYITICFAFLSLFAVSEILPADDHHDKQRGKQSGKPQNEPQNFDRAMSLIKNEIRKAQEKGDRKKAEELIRRARGMEMSKLRARGRGEHSPNDHRGDRRPEVKGQNPNSPQVIINRMSHQIRDLHNQVAGMRREIEEMKRHMQHMSRHSHHDEREHNDREHREREHNEREHREREHREREHNEREHREREHRER